MKLWEGRVGFGEGFFILAVFAALSAYLLNWAIGAAVHSRKTETVPDLKGHSIAAALSLVSPMGLGLREQSEEFDSSVPIGSVLRQDPVAGAVVREGKIVKIVISQGGQAEIAPSLSGLPLRNAEMLLRENELGLGEVNQAYSLNFDKGAVMAQDPKEESSVEKNSLVNVTISAGAPPASVILMPDFQRKNIAQAQIWADKRQISMQQASDPNSLFPYGAVLSQTPPPDTVLSPDTTVSFVISGKITSGTPSRGARMFHYQIPKHGTESLLRVVVIDKYGEREAFNGLRRAGSLINIPINEPVGVGAHLKIFLNGILVEEKDL
ncbi:MAG: PASTA domain-containing protein [Elusimicrobiota bacterium]